MDKTITEGYKNKTFIWYAAWQYHFFAWFEVTEDYLRPEGSCDPLPPQTQHYCFTALT